MAPLGTFRDRTTIRELSAVGGPSEENGLRHGMLTGAAAIFLLGTPQAGFAGSTCDVVAAAMLRVSDQPGVHQRTILAEPARLEMEAILLPDAMYVREDDKAPWQKLPIRQVERKAMARMALQTTPLSECSGPSTGLDGPMPVQIYQYRQPDPMKPGTFTANALWIGGDGLPRRLVLSATSYQTMDYANVQAPTDLAPAPPPRSKPAR